MQLLGCIQYARRIRRRNLIAILVIAQIVLTGVIFSSTAGGITSNSSPDRVLSASRKVPTPSPDTEVPIDEHSVNGLIQTEDVTSVDSTHHRTIAPISPPPQDDPPDPSAEVTEPPPPQSVAALPPPPGGSWGAPRFFDVFLFMNEIELLEVRIAELFDVVEKMVVVETLVTFQGAPRQRLFTSLKERLPAHFLSKIVLHQCADLGGGIAWDRERAARQCAQDGLRAVGARAFDLVHFADADEIPNGTTVRGLLSEVRTVMQSTPNATAAIAELRGLYPMQIEMRYHMYNFRTYVKGWRTDVILLFDDDLKVVQRHNGAHTRFILDGGWHCSWCFRSVEQFASKFKSFSHTEFYDERNFSPENIKNCTCNGGWIYQYAGTMYRPEGHFTEAEALAQMPRYLAQHIEEKRFIFLMPNASNCELPLRLEDEGLTYTNKETTPALAVALPAPPGGSWGTPRFFDAFLFTYEIELVEIRIAELFDILEKVVVVETLVTFQGKPREPLFTRLKERLPPHFLPKIVVHQCTDLGSGGNWDRERAARRCAQDGLRAAGVRAFDFVHFSDADELINATTIRRLMNETRYVMHAISNTTIAMNTLRTMYPMQLDQIHLLYNFRTRAYGWRSDLYLLFSDDDVANVRRHNSLDIVKRFARSAGWHCSWCFRSVEQFAVKFKSFSHGEFYDERNFSPENIKNCTCNGGWIYEFRGTLYRPARRMTEAEALAIMPRYLAQHITEPRFIHLMPTESNCELPLTLGDMNPRNALDMSTTVAP